MEQQNKNKNKIIKLLKLFKEMKFLLYYQVISKLKIDNFLIKLNNCYLLFRNIFARDRKMFELVAYIDVSSFI